MSDRYPGGIIIKNPTAPTTTVASGIWTLEQQAYYKAQGTWPLPPYFATNSLRFRSSASAYLSRTPASAGNRQKWTYSTWVKKSKLGSRQNIFQGGNHSAGSNSSYIEFSSGNVFRVAEYDGSVETYSLNTSQVFSDPSSWYHLVVAVDTTQASASNRIKVYVNGTQVTAFATANYPSQNLNTSINNTVIHNIGRDPAGVTSYFDGYQTEINLIDGQQLTPSSFGETNTTTGVWQPKLYTGSYGTNGFYLPFTDIALTSGSNAGLGKDFSGNGNYWNTNNISVTSGTTYDAMIDVPSLTSATIGNYPTLNPLDIQTTSELPTGGNLNANGGNNMRATIACPSSGKWYFEYTRTNTTTSAHVGVFASSSPINVLNSGSMLYRDDGYLYENDVLVLTSWASYTTNDVIGIAVDVDSSQVSFYKNNTLQGTRTLVSQITASSAVFAIRNNTNATASVNFGQRPFTYTPPSGFVALNTYNLPTPAVVQGNDYFAPLAYTGNGATYPTTNAITGLDFKPSFTWIKCRSQGYDHFLYDAVRGAGKYLASNTTGAETTTSQMLSFNSNGFTVANDGGSVGTNEYGQTFVAWNWKGNDAGVSNTDGSITTTVSVSATSGVSIIKYTGNGTTGATIGHGLGKAPKFLICKKSNNVRAWINYHGSLGATKYLEFNNTAASGTSSAVWNNTEPTSSVITLGSNASVNTGSDQYIMYAFAEINGFSSFGTYLGNGSSTGPFIYTGFKPAYVLVKGSDYVSNWNSWDNARNTYNVTSQLLRPNAADAEFNGYTSVGGAINICSNGFQIVKSDGDVNNSGSTFIYIAFAENPFKYALAR